MADRDLEEALITLKKGTQLIKYNRKGKPKFCPFTVSNDEVTLIWYSCGKERNLKLASLSRIIPGQRTICKDKTEADVWFAGLKALITQRQRSYSKFNWGSDDGRDFIQDGHPLGLTQDITSNISCIPPSDPYFNLAKSYVGSDCANMHPRASNVDGFRLSVSSGSSGYSSQGSGPDDCESLGDVYVWGKVWCDGCPGDGPVNYSNSKTDVLLPKPLESNVVLDVHQIACGVRHAALVTRQGEVFTWGEESGGRLGHGNDKDISKPHLVEFLSLHNMDFVACGEYHTCAVSTVGGLFSWGDGTHNAGLLGNGTDISHWRPKRVCGPLEELHVVSIACGTWHSALATSNGKLFTFGDGTFGVLGHGDRESIACPREVESLRGLKTDKVACGIWHTAAIVEVIRQQGAIHSSRKLFTWGDGDKNRLGHGNKEPRLVPTCVSSLIDYNFHQVACGHNITVALATTGHVFTMGSTSHGQLGNPQSDGKLPCLIQDKLAGEFVDEISCGAFHVAALTSRSEVFTWGNGANGRLGHGDVADRKTPTLVEALKDRNVKSISCGSNFTASICIHKWVSGADQSLCSGCRQAFGFTRKRHNCYNCGLVHCHACSSKRVLRAALAPTPGKPHRVCDSCYAKLKVSEAGSNFSVKKKMTPYHLIDTRERFDRGGFSKMLLSPKTEPVKYMDVKSAKPKVIQTSHISFPSSSRPIVASSANQAMTSRPASPFSKKSPPPSATSVFSRGIIDSLKSTNDLLNQELQKLQEEVKSLRQKCELQDVVMRKSKKEAREAALVATEESSRYSAAKEIMKSLTGLMNDMAEKLAPEVYDVNKLKSVHAQVEALLKNNRNHTSEHSSLMVDSSDGAGGLPLGAKESSLQHGIENDRRSPRIPSVRFSNEGGAHLIEQFEPGVYVTLVQLHDGTKVFKSVRFSKRKFVNWQAEEWWKENKKRVFKKYNYPGTDGAAAGSSMNVSTPSKENDGVTSSQS